MSAVARPRLSARARCVAPALLLMVAALACARARTAGSAGGADSTAVAAVPPAAAPEASAVPSSPAAGLEGVAPPAVRAPQPFARPVVVFMEASPEEIQAAHAGMSDEDFYVMADDLNWYRSSAWEYLQKRHIPVVRVTGRQPLRFVVADTVRSYDFTDERTLDLLVVFDGRRPPRPVAAIDVQAVDTLLRADSLPSGAR